MSGQDLPHLRRMTGQSCRCQVRSMATVNRHRSDDGARGANKTSLAPKARELLTERTDGLPVWIRAPKFGQEFYTGFSRAKLYEGAGKRYFRSVSIREPGQIKGTRLF